MTKKSSVTLFSLLFKRQNSSVCGFSPHSFLCFDKVKRQLPELILPLIKETDKVRTNTRENKDRENESFFARQRLCFLEATHLNLSL